MDREGKKNMEKLKDLILRLEETAKILEDHIVTVGAGDNKGRMRESDRKIKIN